MTEPGRCEDLPDVSVLIVNWNTGDLLRRCIETIPAAMSGLRSEVIVVDNASTDDSLEHLPAVPGLQIIRRPDNAGFAAATNQAAACAKGRMLLLLNPDTECMPGSMRQLADYLSEHSDIAALGPRLVNPDGSPQRSAWRGYPGLAAALIDAFYLWKLPALPGVRLVETPLAVARLPIKVDHLLGACILIPRRAWNAIGPLDAGYFLFLEETDWCRSATQAGWRVVQLPSAVVMHHGQQSVHQAPSRSAPSYYRGYLRFARKGGTGPFGICLLKLTLALGVWLRLGLWMLRIFGPRHRLARRMLAGYGRALWTIARA